MLAPLKEIFYRTHYLVTVRVSNGNRFIVEGGKEEKFKLEKAKNETNFCFVKDSRTGSEVKLELIKGKWRIAF